MKNAYALVRQRRHELAAAFFILGRAYSEAMDVCCGQLDDPQLALFLALLLEHQEIKNTATSDIKSETSKESAFGLRKSVLEKKVLPLSVHANDAWLECLVLWLLSRYEEAVVATLPPDIRPHVNHPACEAPVFGSQNEKSAILAKVSSVDSMKGRLTVNLFPDPFQRRTTFIGGSRSLDADEVAGAISSHSDEHTTFCCGAIRYSPLNPTIATFRRNLLDTVQLRRALHESIVASEFVQVVQNVCERERSEGEMHEIHSPRVSRKPDAKLYISPAVVAAVVVICEEVVNLLDLGEALLFCLSHRLPFQGLQHFTDLRILMKRLRKSSGKSIFDLSKSLSCEFDVLRVRWNCAVGFSRHACDALGYLTAVKLKETEDDVEWMDCLFDETVETFGPASSPLCLAACAWKGVVDDHGCEHHYQGENFISWVSRQIEGPVEIHPQLIHSAIELPAATPGPLAPVVESAVESAHDASSLEIHVYDEQRHKEAWLVEVFAAALRGMPAWSLLSAKQSWTEQVVFRGVSTCTIGLIDLLSQARRIGTFGPHSFHTVLAKTLTLQAGVKTAVAWTTQPSTSSEARQLLLASAMIAASCISTSAVFLLLMRLGSRASEVQSQDSMDAALQYMTTKVRSLSEDEVLKSPSWKEWPLHLPLPFLWKSIEQLLTRMDRLESCYIDSLTNQQSGWLETDDGNACADYISTELLRFMDFVAKAIFMPKVDAFKLPAEAMETSQDTVSRKPATPVGSNAPPATAVGTPGTKIAPVMTARSEPMQGLLTAKAEAALDVTMRAIDSNQEMKRSMRELILSVLQSALIDKILGDMSATEDAARTVLELYTSPEPSQTLCASGMGGAVWHSTVCQTLVAFQSFATRLRETYHGPVVVEAYGSLLAHIATEFPFLPMALTSPLAFPKDAQTLNEEAAELLEIDNTCVALASASGASDTTARAFRGIWSALSCSRRLQLLIGRGPVLGFPSSMSVGTICPDQLPIHSRVIACLKEAPLCISIDKAADAPFIHHFGSLGPPLASVQPFGLGVPGIDGVGQTGRSGLGVLSVSTSHGVWETNIVHSVMFHRSFSATAITAIGATTTAAVVASLTGSVDSPEAQISHSSILSHQANLFHLHQMGTHPSPQSIDFDDDLSKHRGSLAQGKLRPYDLAAEIYERQVADQVLVVFNSVLTARRSGDRKDAVERSGILASSDTSGRESDTGKDESVVTRTAGKSVRRANRVRPHWQSNKNKSEHHHHHHSILRLHLLSRSKVAAAQTPVDSQELPLYHFNFLLELLLRGLVGPLADLSIPHLESTSVHSHSPARACLLDEESALMVAGLSLFPLPASPQKSLLPSLQQNTLHTPTRFRTNLTSCILTPGPHRSAAAWVRLTATLQQRLARNRLVELQLACLPPTSSHDHGKPMALLRPHPNLPVCAGVIADSQVVNTSLGTLVISLWKVGEPHIRELGWLAMPPQKGPTFHTQASDRLAVDAKLESKQSGLSDGKRGGISGKLGADGTSGGTSESLGLSYSEAGPIKSLEWDPTGEKLISGHNKGWVAIWQLRSDRHARVDASIPQRHHRDELVHVGQLEHRSSEHRLMLLGLPSLTFKPHTSFCRFALFLQSGSGASLIITSGRGLAPTPLLHYHSRRDTPSQNNNTGHIVSAGPDEGVVCIWDITPSRLGPPQLLMWDTGFEKGSYAIHAVVWAARQAVLCCGKKGEIRLINLRNPSHHRWLVHPIGANQQRMSVKQEHQVGRGDYDMGGNGATTATAGPYGKEIVKMFLLEQGRRLVTCYEDSMVGDYCD